MATILVNVELRLLDGPVVCSTFSRLVQMKGRYEGRMADVRKSYFRKLY